MPYRVLPVLNMKNMRYLLLALALGLGLCAQHVQGQTAAQNMTFSIICQYATNTSTNINLSAKTTNVQQQIVTVLLNSGNLVKAMTIDMLGTNWTQWQNATLVYEVNLKTTNQGIFLRLNGKQTNVSQFFAPNFTNLFSQNAAGAFNAINYTITGTNPTTLPLIGGYVYDKDGVITSNYTSIGNFAYLTFETTNISFNLFGFSQGSLINVVERYDNELYTNQVDKAEIIGAGTFSLNVTTNIFPYLDITNFTTPNYYTGLAHGTIYTSGPYYLNIEGP
jgi:hypothetical protein